MVELIGGEKKKTNKHKTHKHFSDSHCRTIVPGKNRYYGVPQKTASLSQGTGPRLSKGRFLFVPDTAPP